MPKDKRRSWVVNTYWYPGPFPGGMLIWHMGDDNFGDCELVSVTHTPDTMAELMALHASAAQITASLIMALHIDRTDALCGRKPVGTHPCWGKGKLNVPIIYEGRPAPHAPPLASPLECEFPRKRRCTGVIDFDDDDEERNMT